MPQYVRWSEIDSMTQILSDKVLKTHRVFSSITTVSRGGLVPARLLADRLGIKTILVDQEIISSESLFVDDIFDSGKTFEKTISSTDNPSQLIYATLFARRDKEYPQQLVYSKMTNDNEYVVFPWDMTEFHESQ